MNKFIAVFFLTMISMPSFSDDQAVVEKERVTEFGPDYINREEDGWFFYQIPPKVIKAIEKVIKTEVTKQVAERLEEIENKKKPMPGTSDWIRVNVDGWRDRAGDNPSPENVRAHMYIERIMHAKAQSFAQQATIEAATNPYLDTSGNQFTVSGGPTIARQISKDNKTKLSNKVLETGVIWIFIDDSCSMCGPYFNMLDTLQSSKLSNLKMYVSSLDGTTPPPYPDGSPREYYPANNERKTLSITTTPTTFVYQPQSQEFGLIGQGYMGYEDFLERINLASVEKGWLTTSEYMTTNLAYLSDQWGWIDWNKMMAQGNEQGIDFDDPQEFNKFINRQFEKVREEYSDFAWTIDKEKRK